MKIPFTKMHGLGNDFVLIDGRTLGDLDWAEMARQVCRRHTGVGADGILLLLDSDKADVRMRIINSDGSEAEMCGNGIRCLCRYAYEHGVVQKTAIRVETLAGIMQPSVNLIGGEFLSVTVDMGVPFIDPQDVPVSTNEVCINQPLHVLGETFRVTSVLTGVPHTTVFVEDLDSVDIATFGCAIEHAPIFPRRTNVDFVTVRDAHNIEMRTWERGCGRTLACGTGACGAVVACVLNDRTSRSVDVHIQLGVLHVDWKEDNHVYMTGPAAVSFTGELVFPE